MIQEQLNQHTPNTTTLLYHVSRYNMIYYNRAHEPGKGTFNFHKSADILCTVALGFCVSLSSGINI